MNILRITTSSKGYVLFMFTHRARVVKQSIIFGRILFKFDGHILQMTTSYMGYVLMMFNHCVHACMCERACASASVIKRSLIFERILFKCGGDMV
jgi:hypothetical protein